ncbi:helix-turn-helix transcriptional regulator [Microvirga subterranea]|uniref:DNA-binding CsgD family transcriptional regulator n=1 Tax=Microvirga subterranea TaxID=186651 RepID=A0A370HJH3_9HYPH|nr:helix-turn-helix transcriptional regulator [Microvirga subterranea]RDI57920.1 DNA-binding CsgD family transcriptional regulator [Microvirga subterranea]
MACFDIPSSRITTLECFGRIFDALGFATVIIGGEGQVMHVSHLAEQHLGAGLVIKSGTLAATDAGSDKDLQAILGEHISGAKRERDALGLRRIERRPLILRIVELTPDMRPIFDEAKFVAALVDPDVCPEPSPALLQQIFGLTKREAHVALKLMCGDTLQEMAEQTGVSVGTVRTQAKAVFAKTGTNRQAELVGILTRLAVISHEPRPAEPTKS